MKTLVLLLAVLLVVPLARAEGDLDWPPITNTTKPWAYWWWHGSAVDTNSLAHVSPGE